MRLVHRFRFAVSFAGLSVVVISLTGGCAPQRVATSTTPLVPAASPSPATVATPPGLSAPIATKLTPRAAVPRFPEPPPPADPTLGPAALRRCRNARQKADCEAVLAYLRANPNGARASEAEAAWKLAEARIERVADGSTK